MKNQKKATWFVSGVLCSAIMASSVIPAVAALVEKKLTVHTGVQVYVDDVKIDAGDTHGNPDAFIYNGTTYVAVAAVSKSLGENVKWDGDTKSVYIGKHEGASYNLLSVCPPYQSEDYYELATVQMGGKKFANAFRFNDRWGDQGGYTIFNLDSKYDSLSFDFGHLDGEFMHENREFCIYLDDELVFSLTPDPEDMPKHYTVDLNGAVQMKITGNSDYFAFANVKVS